MKTLTTLLTCAVLLAAGPVLASHWGGHHGTIHLSINSADEIVPVADAAGENDAGVLVEVTAVISDLQPLLFNGVRVMALGGFEIMLAIEGADDARVVSKTITEKHLDMSNDPASCVVGIFPDLTLKDGSSVLVTWTVWVPGPPHPVKFYLDPAGVESCESLEPCAGSGSPALWSGSLQARQHDLLFSAGYVPAYLNWEGEADLTPIHGTTDWSETGLFTLSE
jgi:hypothetical protein